MNNIFYKFLNISLFSRYIPFILLKEQLIIGRIFFAQFWFLFNLLFFTIGFFIMSLKSTIKTFLMINLFFSSLSYILQYSKYNYFFFDRYKDCVSHSVGHFVESFPIAITAFFFNNTDIVNNLKKRKIIIFFFCIIFSFLICKYGAYMEIEKYGKTYNYNGFDKNIFSFFTFIAFYLNFIIYNFFF